MVSTYLQAMPTEDEKPVFKNIFNITSFSLFSHSNAVWINFPTLVLETNCIIQVWFFHLFSIKILGTSQEVGGEKRWECLVINPSLSPPSILPTNPFSHMVSAWLHCTWSTSKQLQPPASLSSHHFSRCLNRQYKHWHRPPGLSKGHGKLQK